MERADATTSGALGVFGLTIDTMLATMRGSRPLTDDEAIACFTQIYAVTAAEMTWKYAVQCGAYEVVVSAMRSRASSAAFQAAACHWLTKFGMTREAVAATSRLQPAIFVGGNCYHANQAAHAARAGAFEAIVAAMLTHLGVPLVMCNGCSALGCLLLDKGNRRAAFNAGVLEALFCALRMGEVSEGNATPAAVSTLACQALAVLVLDCAENAAAAARADVFEAVFNAMRKHPEAVGLQGVAFMALAEISMVQLTPKAAAAAARGVALIVAALKTHTASSSLPVGVGLGALQHILVDNEEAQARAADAGGIQWIVTYMRNSEAAPPVACMNDVLPELHFERCCQVLSTWAADSVDYLAKCVAAGAIEAVVVIMRSRHTEASVQMVGCEILALFSAHSSVNKPPESENQTRAGNAGAIDTIVRAMRTHAADVEVQRSCMNCLEFLCVDHRSNLQRLVAGVPVLVQAMQTHFSGDDKASSEIQMIGTVLLSASLADCTEAYDKAERAACLVSLGALEAVSRALLKHHSECRIHVLGPTLLLDICAAGDEWARETSTGPILKRYGPHAARAGAPAALRAVVAYITERGMLGPTSGCSAFKATVAARAIQLADELDAIPLRACDGCGTTDTELKRCSRCLSARFCSAACQRRAWGTHSLLCRAPAATVTADAAPTNG